jgi:hypothetical protein
MLGISWSAMKKLDVACRASVRLRVLRCCLRMAAAEGGPEAAAAVRRGLLLVFTNMIGRERDLKRLDVPPLPPCRRVTGIKHSNRDRTCPHDVTSV